ncbi:OmpA family protein [Maribacter polysaccharolyticus]|uniref:OmpA family protein n=1 Tax=Maribacter polysaccharolyticus TaxID=3020831 RepID=UPI00237F17A6|nr:OmpA family protein [Maribacter polysaccharolyticus]
MGWSQNLIVNPSFEMHKGCPKALGNFNADVESWSTPTVGSTDYFNGCSTAMGTPENFKGSQPADFGVGYAGLYLYAPGDYREYIQAELLAPLQQGKKYKISFYVSLAERSDFAIKEFGLLFSKNRLNFPIRKVLSKMHWYKDIGNEYHYMEIGYSDFVDDTKDWILVHSQFTAKGNERFLTFGNFKDNQRTRKFTTKHNSKQGAYYYIDMVLLESAEAGDYVEEPKVWTAETKTAKVVLDENHIFKNVFFNFDRSEVLQGSKEEIQDIYRFLEKDKTLRIEIHGHTDSIGTEEYNLVLSELRAKAVAEYLMGLGLSKERIFWEGHGGTEPIVSNASEEGRKQNRRVEFIISKSMGKTD